MIANLIHPLTDTPGANMSQDARDDLRVVECALAPNAFIREFALNHFARSASESSPAASARNDAAASTSVAVIRTPFNSTNKNE